MITALASQGWVSHPVWSAGGGEEWPPVPGWSSGWSPLAVFALRPGPVESAPWLDSAESRGTNRGPFSPEPLNAAERSALEGIEGPPWSGPARLERIDDPARIRSAAAFVRAHAARDFADPAAWTETHRYLQFDSAAAPPETGFTLEQLFGPVSPWSRALFRIALSPGFQRVPGAGSVQRKFAAGLAELVETSPALIACTVPSQRPTPSELFGAGAKIIELWLRATAAGLAVHPVSVVLQHPDLRTRFEEELTVAPRRCVFFARVGRPTRAFPPTGRRAPELNLTEL